MEQDTTTTAPVVDNSRQSSERGWKIAAVIASIVAVCGIGFGVYGMVGVNDSNQPSEISDEPEVTDDESGDQELNEYEKRDLTKKTFRLLGFRNGLSSLENYNDDTGNFIITSGYMPTAQLITNDLDEASKVYITLETTMLDKEKRCDYRWTDGVKDDVNAALGQQASDISFGDTNIDCISYDRANDDYYDLWGENMPKINGFSDSPTNNVGDFAYGPHLDAYYYHVLGGRGGTCSSFVVGKIMQIDKNQDFAYVGINAGAFEICAGNAGELYSAIERGELYKTIEQDNISLDGLDLAEDDYKSLQFYRFKFTKNSDDIYSFSTIEEL